MKNINQISINIIKNYYYFVQDIEGYKKYLTNIIRTNILITNGLTFSPIIGLNWLISVN